MQNPLDKFLRLLGLTLFILVLGVIKIGADLIFSHTGGIDAIGSALLGTAVVILLPVILVLIPWLRSPRDERQLTNLRNSHPLLLVIVAYAITFSHILF